jgi:hypothetical protein
MTASTLTAGSAPAPGAGADGLGWALGAFIWLLPFHILTMALLFGAFGVSATVVRVLSAWKEMLAAALIAFVVVRALAGSRPRLTVRAADPVLAALGLLALVYFLGAGVWFGYDIPLGAQALGLRDAAGFCLLYFVGRCAPGIADDPRYLRAIVAVGVVTSVIAIFERLLVTPQALVLLGATRYIKDFLGLGITTSHNPYGLPDSYWTILGSHLVQRAGSTYLSSQGFAVQFLVILPAATIALFTAQRRRGWALAACAVLWAGLLLSITRVTTLACVIQLFVLAALYDRWATVVRGAAIVTVVLAAALVAVPGFATLVLETLTWQSASSISHLEIWGMGLAQLLEHPLGLGLGAGSLVAARFGLPVIAGDNQYLTYSTTLGLPGLLLYAAVLVTLLAAGLRAFRTAGTASARDYGALVAVAALGIAINGITTDLISNAFLSYTFFWLAGTAVSAIRDRV